LLFRLGHWRIAARVAAAVAARVAAAVAASVAAVVLRLLSVAFLDDVAEVGVHHAHFLGHLDGDSGVAEPGGGAIFRALDLAVIVEAVDKASVVDLVAVGAPPDSGDEAV